MGGFRQGCALVLSLTLWAAAAAAEQKPAETALYDRPVLVVDPGMHTAIIRRVDADRAGNLGGEWFRRVAPMRGHVRPA